MSMSPSTIQAIDDPVQRLVQSTRALHLIPDLSKRLSAIRNVALLELREDGYTQDEIASLLGISRGRVSVMEAHARQASS